MWPENRVDFGKRVSPRELPELMDGECSYEEFRQCLRSLEQVNRWLLGYRPTLAWLDRLSLPKHEPMHLLDVGSGGGGLLQHIASWATRQGIALQLTGIDLNPYAARAARELTHPQMKITWITGDVLNYVPDTPIDLIVSSLMMHHLEDHEIVTLLRWMNVTANVGWFINDLARSERSARVFSWLAHAVGWHDFVKHDGPVSFQRAFSQADWTRLLQAAGVERSSVELKAWWPGRLCVGTRQ